MKKKFYLSLFILFNLFVACSSSEEATKEEQKKEPDIYVFDDIEKDQINLPDSLNKIPPVQELKAEPIKTEPVASSLKYAIQLGAFSTKERAQIFIDENKNKISYNMVIIFRDNTKLFSVQIPAVATKEEAEKIRNDLWKIPSFKDAFLLTKE